MVVEKVMKWFRCQYSTFPHNTLSLIKHLEWSSGQCLPFAQKIMNSNATISTCLINFFNPLEQKIHTQCTLELQKMVSGRGLVAAASLNVSGGSHLNCKTINICMYLPVMLLYSA